MRLSKHDAGKVLHQSLSRADESHVSISFFHIQASGGREDRSIVGLQP